MVKNFPWLFQLLAHCKTSLPAQVFLFLLALTMLSLLLDSVILSVL